MGKYQATYRLKDSHQPIMYRLKARCEPFFCAFPILLCLPISYVPHGGPPFTATPQVPREVPLGQGTLFMA